MEKKPTDYIEEWKALQQYYESNDNADSLFKKQVAELEEISKKKWYKQIKEFFTRQYNNWLIALQEVDANNIAAMWKIQWQTAANKKFLDFLTNIEKKMW